MEGQSASTPPGQQPPPTGTFSESSQNGRPPMPNMSALPTGLATGYNYPPEFVRQMQMYHQMGGMVRAPPLFSGYPIRAMNGAMEGAANAIGMETRAGGGIGSGSTAGTSMPITPAMVRSTPPLLQVNHRPPYPTAPSPLLQQRPQSQNQYSQAPGPNISSPLPILTQLYTVPPYNSQMDEKAFLESLGRFMHLCNCPIKKIPYLKPDKQLPMLKLFQLVAAFGGFRRVDESKRWTAIAVSLGMSPITPETVGSLRRLYASLLFAYEQVFFSKVPLDKVICTISKLSFYLGNFFNVSCLGPQQVIQHLHAINEPSKANVTDEQQLKREVIKSTVPPITNEKAAKPDTDHTQGQRTFAKATMAAPSTAQKKISENPIVDDPVEILLRHEKNLKKVARSTLNYGRVSLEELVLMLSSDDYLLESATLCIIERISFDTTQLDIKFVGPLLDAFCNLLQKEFLTIDSNPINVGGQRPFDFLLRLEESKTYDLLYYDEKKNDSSARIIAIFNTVKNLTTSLEQQWVRAIAEHEVFINRILLPLITNASLWSTTSLELYSLAWFILHQVLPYIKQLSESKVVLLCKMALQEIEISVEFLYKWTHILHWNTLFDQVQVSHRVLTRFMNLVPVRCFLLIDMMGRLVSNKSIIISLDETTDAQSKIEIVLSRGLHDMLDAFYLLLPIVYGYFNLAFTSLRSAIESSKYVDQVGYLLHNVNLSLNDSGYIELLLQNITLFLERISIKSDDDPWFYHLVRVLLNLIDTFVSLYCFPCPEKAPFLVDVQGQLKSILCPQDITAHHSHPYRIYLLTLRILGLIRDNSSKLGLGLCHADLLMGWLCKGEDISPVHRDLLMWNDVEKIVNSLLFTISFDKS